MTNAPDPPTSAPSSPQQLRLNYQTHEPVYAEHVILHQRHGMVLLDFACEATSSEPAMIVLSRVALTPAGASVLQRLLNQVLPAPEKTESPR